MRYLTISAIMFFGQLATAQETPTEVTALIKQLGDKDSSVRAKVAKKLREMPADHLGRFEPSREAMEALSRAFIDDDWRVVAAAEDVLPYISAAVRDYLDRQKTSTENKADEVFLIQLRITLARSLFGMRGVRFMPPFETDPVTHWRQGIPELKYPSTLKNRPQGLPDRVMTASCSGVAFGSRRS